MPTFLINTDGVESVAVHQHSCDAIIAAAEGAPGCKRVALKVLPYDIGTKLVDILTGETFFITGITPTCISYNGFAGSGKAAREHLESVFQIHKE